MVSAADASQANPIEKILEMISDLQAKVIAEGEDAQKEYDPLLDFKFSCRFVVLVILERMFFLHDIYMAGLRFEWSMMYW